MNVHLYENMYIQGTGRGQMGQHGTIYYSCFIPHSLSVQGTGRGQIGQHGTIVYILQLFHTPLSLSLQGTWAWTDGSAWDYTNWGVEQPGGSAKWNCLLSNVNTNARDEWYDFPCDYGRSYVCKI